MDLDLGIDIPAPPDGSPRPVPYESNGAAWHDAFCMLLALRTARGLYMRPGDQTSGDQMVRQFARRLRASGANIVLHRIQRHIAVTDDRLVLCIYGLAVQYGLERDRGLGMACMMAVGFNPPMIRRVARLLLSCRWAVCYENYRGGLYCAEWYLTYVSGGAPIDKEEVRWFRDGLSRLPTFYDSKGGADAEPNA